MASTTTETPTNRYARAVTASKRARWNLDTDVIRDRTFDAAEKFLPDGLTLVGELAFLSDRERVLFSQVQGRTYAKVFGLVERFITTKVLEIGERHTLGDQNALEAMVRFSDEEIKHQELFRRIEVLAAQAMPDGYTFAPDPNDVARVVLKKSTWAVLALTLLIELFTQAHYKESIEPDDRLSRLFKDVFRFHWMEEGQHAVLDDLEWHAEDARLGDAERDRAVSEVIDLVQAVDGILRAQSKADAEYFIGLMGRPLPPEEQEAIQRTFLRAYRHQYILSGVERTRFTAILRELITEQQFGRIAQALSTLQ
jgi:hypothetical protein